MATGVGTAAPGLVPAQGVGRAENEYLVPAQDKARAENEYLVPGQGMCVHSRGLGLPSLASMYALLLPLLSCIGVRSPSLSLPPFLSCAAGGGQKSWHHMR